MFFAEHWDLTWKMKIYLLCHCLSPLKYFSSVIWFKLNLYGPTIISGYYSTVYTVMPTAKEQGCLWCTVASSVYNSLSCIIYSLSILLFFWGHNNPGNVILSPGTDGDENSATPVPLDSGVVMLASAGGPAPASLTATILNLWRIKETGFGLEVSFERLLEKRFLKQSSCNRSVLVLEKIHLHKILLEIYKKNITNQNLISPDLKGGAAIGFSKYKFQMGY